MFHSSTLINMNKYFLQSNVDNKIKIRFNKNSVTFFVKE